MYIFLNVFSCILDIIYIVCVCIYIYIHIINVHSTVHTHILCKQKLLFWMRLIEINRLTALIYVHNVNINILGYFQGKKQLQNTSITNTIKKQKTYKSNITQVCYIKL